MASSSYNTGSRITEHPNRIASVSAVTGTRLTVKYLQQFWGISES